MSFRPDPADLKRLREWVSGPGAQNIALASAAEFQRRDKVRERQHKRVVHHRCSYCGKGSTDTLRVCSLCKSARYCDRECQVADYKTRHKAECAGFVHPPFTTSFLTEPLGDDKYPQDPLFAKGHLNGVGFWVSVSSSVDCALQTLANPLRPIKDPLEYNRRDIRMLEDPNLGVKYKARTRNLLTLQVLVQNRRKDGKPVVVFGARTRVLTSETPTVTQNVLNGRTEADRITIFTDGGRGAFGTYASIAIAEDMFDQSPRLLITNVNGTVLKEGVPLPSAVKNGPRGIVALHPGEFALLHMQFRIGDGDLIVSEWDALSCLRALAVPVVAPYDPAVCNTTSLDASISLKTDPVSGKLIDELASPGVTEVRLPFDFYAAEAYYEDLSEKGELAFIKSHRGEKEAEAWAREHAEMAEHALQTMENIRRLGLPADELNSMFELARNMVSGRRD
ncbi:hypothetical protein K466DRAFT_658079 [Polyporus arcularius HHB13444]|uniref:MYND-type domain-containing protein n=1 Tax=Polyporus arcularius HHB13444 TaxID=1314778 RepID=A0A5C3PWR1_9APHY|nr:hypothetical protein K466DRAFT_658079 [Polyporus arcularius HHB13444]